MDRNSENGNVIIFIFIAIFLLGALTFSFTSSNRSSTGVVTAAQADAYASDLLSYTNDVHQAVKRLVLRGCSDTEISFENSLVSGYNNPSSQNRCKVFHSDGGGVQIQTVKPDMLLASSSAEAEFGNPFFADIVQVEGIGTTCSTDDCTDLVMFVPYLRREVCNAINSKLGLTNVDLDVREAVNNFSYMDARKFAGAYDFSASGFTSTVGDSGTNSFPPNEPVGCYMRNGQGEYEFFRVLIPR